MRRILRPAILLALSLLAAGALAQPPDPRPTTAGGPWFDPTQLPSFTGTVDRYLPNPSGAVDALLFREGPQIVFPPEIADAVRHVAPPGSGLVVWGIRARKAPVITMLAFAPRPDETPFLVERPYWRRHAAETMAESRVRLAVAGRVRQPFFSPQGDPVGAVLEDGTVVMLPPAAAGTDAAVRAAQALLRPGATLAAEGWGIAEGERRALHADRIGEDAGSLRTLAPAEAPPAGGDASAPTARP